MKTIICLASGILLLAGCASDQGGISDDYYKGYGTRAGQEKTLPAARPAADPNDIRDPEGLTVPWRVPPG